MKPVIFFTRESVWSVPEWAFEVLLDYIVCHLLESPLAGILKHAVRSGSMIDATQWKSSDLKHLYEAALRTYISVADDSEALNIRLGSQPEHVLILQERLTEHMGHLLLLLQDDKRFGIWNWEHPTDLELAVMARGLRLSFKEKVRAMGPFGFSPEDGERILWRLIDELPDGYVGAIIGFSFLRTPWSDRNLLRVAEHPVKKIRLSLFSQLCCHRVPSPASLRLVMSPEGTDAVIRRGLKDDDAEVRGWAAAYAMGAGRLDSVRDLLLVGVADDHPRVRSLCRMALGLPPEPEAPYSGA